MDENGEFMGIGNRIYRNVKRNISLYFLGSEDIRGRQKERLMEEFFIGKLDGCVPDRYLGEDVNQDIGNKFYALFDGIRKEVEKKKLTGEGINIFVSPSYQDRTDILMTQGDRIIYEDHIKAWNLSWETKDEMKKELEQICREIVDKLKRKEG
jgi:hypothetical protein